MYVQPLAEAPQLLSTLTGWRYTNMEFVHNLGLIAVVLGGVSLIFKFMLDAFAKHLERIESVWKAQTNEIHQEVKAVRKELRQHIQEEDNCMENVRIELAGLRAGLSK